MVEHISSAPQEPVAWLLTWPDGQKAVWLEKPNLNTEITVQPLYTAQTPAHLEDLAQWADAAVELFPVHGEKFKEIARVLRAGVAQAQTDLAAHWKERHDIVLQKHIECCGAAQAALDPGMREALERIRDFPVGGHTAAGAMALIARQALASLPPSQ